MTSMGSKMMRVGLIALLLSAGCGVHLGDNYGRRTRAALDAQIGRNAGSPIDGEDAKGVLAAHRGVEGTPSLGAQTGTSYATGGTFVGGSSSQGAPVMRSNPDAPIRLDAVK